MLNSLTLVLSGQAGQGLATIEKLVDQAMKKNYYVFSTKEVMSRVRGGNNTTEIRIASQPVYAYKDAIDMLFLLNDHAIQRLHHRITSDTIIFGEKSFVDQALIDEKGAKFVEFNLTELSKEAGSVLFGNTILFGFIAGLLELDQEFSKDLIRKRFASKSEKIIDNNINAFNMGFEKGSKDAGKVNVEKTDAVKNHRIISGNEAIGIGALAGGVNFITSYPMSPGTSLLEYLSDKSDDFEIVVEQAEDEIAAINMCLGGWYTGARGIVTTSGGGFALMEEGVSLSGITEVPAVIHIAQRPGPATGLPTRTEQADLNLAVYAGHGEFPRIVLAPGSLEDGVLLTQKAFYFADKYQVPVFVLSDQFYLESDSTIPPIKLPEEPLTSFVVETDEHYKRYKVTEEGISPRGIPGYGKGLVKVDSDEHDESGYITEDFDVRVKMHEKRLRKEELILNEYIEPELIGPKDFTKLVIGWGSTYGVLKEAVETSNDDKLAFLHIKEVYPLHTSIAKYIDQADKTAIFENNATGQLANLIKIHLDRSIDHIELKYNGVPYTIDEVDEKLKEVL